MSFRRMIRMTTTMMTLSVTLTLHLRPLSISFSFVCVSFLFLELAFRLLEISRWGFSHCLHHFWNFLLLPQVRHPLFHTLQRCSLHYLLRPFPSLQISGFYSVSCCSLRFSFDFQSFCRKCSSHFSVAVAYRFCFQHPSHLLWPLTFWKQRYSWLRYL